MLSLDLDAVPSCEKDNISKIFFSPTKADLVRIVLESGLVLSETPIVELGRVRKIFPTDPPRLEKAAFCQTPSTQHMHETLTLGPGSSNQCSMFWLRHTPLDPASALAVAAKPCPPSPPGR